MSNRSPSSQLFEHHSASLEKLGYTSPMDIAASTFSSFFQQCRGCLSKSEAKQVYREAKSYRQQLQAKTRKVLTHSNPQLKHVQHLAIDSLQQESLDYEALFGQRADAYVSESSVASMFSPAAYLTELYREGKQLHTSDQPQYLDKRRPDLKSLSLSQSSLDTEVTTLALSNEILLNTIQNRTDKNIDQVYESLASTAYPFDLPYHKPFTNIETALTRQNSSFEALAQALAPSQSVGAFPINTRTAYANHLSPSLRTLLLAPIPCEGEEAELNSALLRHFGTADIEQLSDVEYFCQQVGISRDELNTFLSLPSFQQTNYTQNNHNVHVPLLQPPHQFGGQYLNTNKTEWLGYRDDKLSRIVVEAPTEIMERVNILPSINDSCIKFAAFCTLLDGVPMRYASIKIDGQYLTDEELGMSAPLINGYRVFEFLVTKPNYKLQVGVGDQNIYRPGEWFPSSAPSIDNFHVTFSSIDAASLIKLSQLIRYCKKTDLSPAALDNLIALSQDSAALAITETTLQLTACALEYQQRYALGEDDALVLAGADINAYAPAGELSQFDRLFNNPPLNDVAFTTNDANDTISFDPDDTAYVQERAVLKRALGVDDAGLATLAAIVDDDDLAWPRSLDNLSTLYRVGLWARVHNLTPQELQRLLQLNGKTEDPRGYTLLADYLDAIYSTSQWLVAQQLSVAELNVMTTNAYPETMTSEVDGFIRTLYQALKANNVASISEIDSLHQLLAPHIAATFGLDNVDSAITQQVWVEQIAVDQGLSLTDMASFCDAIVSYCEIDTPTTEESAQLVTFSQALGQLAFIIQYWKLNAAALKLAVNKPSTLGSNLTDKLALNLNTQQALSRYKTLQLCAGEAISECLTLLDTNMLDTAVLGRWLDMPESEVAQAANCVGAYSASLNASQAVFMKEWLDQSVSLGVSVQALGDLLNSKIDQPYSEWQNLAGALVAGVTDSSKRNQMNILLDESLSTALCAYFINIVAPSLPSSISIKNRDELFGYLLIDNQVSGQITTTRLAEAISSVQLYINRCLQGLEESVDRNQLMEAFFTQWNSYNKRYSTWAGVSKLAYYPENYIDPTLRYNQSGLQGELLNELNQNQLNKDSVETAYSNYLNGFEDIANLKVLCGYHHAAELSKGLSYFVGRSSATPYSYYWRSLNHEAGDGAGGYVASAWTDWEEIQGQITPINDEVRPVIFNNRLYIAWVSQQMVSDEGDPDGEPNQKAQYSLQLSHRKINGSWAPAMSFILPNMPTSLFDDEQPKFNLYLSYHPLQDAILFMLYDPSRVPDSYDGIDATTTGGEGTAYGGFIYNNMENELITGDDWTPIYALFSNNLNNSSAPNKLLRYINAASYSVNVTESEAIDTTDSDWLAVSDAHIQNETVDNLVVPAELSYVAKATIETKDISTEPNAVVIPGEIEDHTGGGLSAVSANITAQPINENFEFTAHVQVTTEIDDYDVTLGKVTTQTVSGRWHINEPEVDKYFADDGKPEIHVSFVWEGWHSYGAPIHVVVKNKDTGKVLYDDDGIKFGNGDQAYIFFSDHDPESNSDGRICYEVTGGNTMESTSLLSIEYTAEGFFSGATVSFAGKEKLIKRQPAGTITVPIKHIIKRDPDGNAIHESQNIAVASVGGTWKQAFTLGHLAYTLGRKFTYNWGEGEIELPQNGSTNIDKDYEFEIPANGLSTTRTLTVKQDGEVVYKQDFKINAIKNEATDINPNDNIQIIDDNQASYLENSTHPKRTRLNTLFAHELVKRAQSGLDNVLSWDTQQLPEPKLGDGTYVKLVFEPYDPQIHGNSKEFTVYHVEVFEDGDAFPVASGTLSKDQKTEVQFFISRHPGGYGDKDHLFVKAQYQSGWTERLLFDRTEDTDETAPKGWHLKGELFEGLDSAQALQDKTEPMDFNGANGLYFWELFYYTPMMVAEKLLQSQNFEEAERWLKYVFSPEGYLEGKFPERYHVDRQWNSRPLEEDTAWDETQADSTDPDVVAQADPMHYKVTTVMKLLDVLIARGDMAYRQLERDTLAEAKMWYLSALQLLGPQPDLPEQANWSDPTLSQAASETTMQQSLMLMERLVRGETSELTTLEARTANSLTALFLPSENDKLKGYWQTLELRLFNLRHNLSIDGQPLTLPLFATPADPKALQNAAAASAGGTDALPNNATIAIQRFPVMLESARNLVGQLIQYGSTLSSVLERKDSEALNALLQTQAQELMQYSQQLQDKTIEQLQAEQKVLSASLDAATARRDSYQKLLNEGVSTIERQSINERIASGSMSVAANAMRSAGAALDMAPNVFGMAVGGSRWGAVTSAIASGMDISAIGLATAAEAHSLTEQYRRRQQEWSIQRDSAAHECAQLEAQQHSLAVQLEAAQLQKDYVAIQQAQTQAQLDFLKTKFSNVELYSWMQGRLSAVFYQFYDLTVARCMKAELGYQWETKDTSVFIQPGAWDGNYAGLLSGEALLLNLAQMESAYLEWDRRALEVNRTVSMAQEMGMDSAGFNAEVNQVLDETASSLTLHTLEMGTDSTVFIATIDLNALAIADDYPDAMLSSNSSPVRRIKQISVSLPALLGPYEDIQAVLGYSGNGKGIHQSCTHTAISHGINDSGQFQLDFNDSKYLPFEGLPINGDDSAKLTLSFPNAGKAENVNKQRSILQSLNDIVLHIRYTILTD
ncbi:Tc toxin subunit A-related protein [Vibrio campbellii]|uniref:Tc toxin subunit A-related protein n=1 Tax=Vibrio campbellii TaxID=680 RepID=UPI0038CDB046